MARCFVTVEGKTTEVDATSKFAAVFAYDADQRTGAAHCRTFPPLGEDTPATIRAAGHSGTYVATLRQAKAWATRWCDGRARREREAKHRGQCSDCGAWLSRETHVRGCSAKLKA